VPPSSSFAYRPRWHPFEGLGEEKYSVPVERKDDEEEFFSEEEQ
jgi:hypothetical protein